MSTFNKIRDYHTHVVAIDDLKVSWGRTMKEFQEHDLPGTDDHDWDCAIYLNGNSAENEGYISVDFGVSTPVMATVAVKLEGTDYERKMTCAYKTYKEYHGFDRFISHDELRPLFTDGTFFITCKIEVHVYVLPPITIFPRFTFPRDGVTSIHPDILTHLSPKVKEMDTANKCEYTLMRLCYGYEVKNLSTTSAFDIIKLAKKWKMTNVIRQLESHIAKNITMHNFFVVLPLIWYTTFPEVKESCRMFYESNKKEVKKHCEFRLNKIYLKYLY